jgi:beta-glucosidase
MRQADWVTQVTTWPSSMTMAASWDVDLMEKYGAALGSEQRGKGMQVMLGPGVNLARVPVGGRNFEYLGEDPVLASAPRSVDPTLPLARTFAWSNFPG